MEPRVKAKITKVGDSLAEAKCSFCGKARSRVQAMVGGPTHPFGQVFICNECVALCSATMANEPSP